MVVRDPSSNARWTVDAVLAADDLDAAAPLVEAATPRAAIAEARSRRAPVLLSRHVIAQTDFTAVAVEGLAFPRSYVLVSPAYGEADRRGPRARRAHPRAHPHLAALTWPRSRTTPARSTGSTTPSPICSSTRVCRGRAGTSSWAWRRRGCATRRSCGAGRRSTHRRRPPAAPGSSSPSAGWSASAGCSTRAMRARWTSCARMPTTRAGASAKPWRWRSSAGAPTTSRPWRRRWPAGRTGPGSNAARQPQRSASPSCSPIRRACGRAGACSTQATDGVTVRRPPTSAAPTSSRPFAKDSATAGASPSRRLPRRGDRPSRRWWRAWRRSGDRDLRWIARENLRKRRLERVDADWVATLLARLD